MARATFNGGPLNGLEVELSDRAVGVDGPELNGSYELRDGALHWTAGPATATPDAAAEPAPDVEHIRPAAPPTSTRRPS